MAMGGYGLPKILLGLVKPYFYTLREAVPEIALLVFQGWPPAGRVVCRRLLPPVTSHAIRL
jgi:hypothetical protein